jgi:UPF0755 protein
MANGLKKNFLLIIFLIFALMLFAAGCQKITQEDIDRQSSRWLILLYKITDNAAGEKAYALISGVEEKINTDFGSGEKSYTGNLSISDMKIKYKLLSSKNKLLEEALVSLKGQEALKEVDGKFSLEDPYLIEKTGGKITMADVNNLALLSLFSSPQKEAAEELVIMNMSTSEPDLIFKLKEQGYIRSAWALNFILQAEGWEGKIEPGGYNVSKKMNAWQLADTLANHPFQKWAVIPEGLRAAEIAEKLQGTLGWKDAEKENFLQNSKEGYLFPDTYLLNIDYSGKDAAIRMENIFNEKAAPLFEKAKENNILNDTLIVLASIIQREAANEEEMPLIAGIIWNRWLKDMNFEVDATIQYALGKPGSWWPVIKVEDYKFDSPYNTYLYKGRPPAPICSPGLAAIKSVIYPEKSEYLYYLHDESGQIHPAVTYEEHLANIKKYLK